MSGKDLLAVLLMVVPSFLLVALIAIALLPPKDAQLQTGVKKSLAAGDASARPRRDIATQDMIRDFWGRPYCASCVQVSETARCNSSAHDDERSCF